MSADIYAACAILRYMITYQARMHGVSAPGAPGSPLEGILEKGLSEAPEARYHSMQELIYALAPFNRATEQEMPQADAAVQTAPAGETMEAPACADMLPREEQPAAAQGGEAPLIGAAQAMARITPEEASAQKKKRRRIRAIAIPAAACALLAGVICYYVVNFNAAADAMRALDFETVDKRFHSLPLGKTLFPKEAVVAEACRLAQENAYEEAQATLETLPDEAGLDTLRKEIRYRQAHWCVQTQAFDEAVAIFGALAGYRDSAEQIPAAQYRQAGYLMERKNAEDFTKAERLLKQLGRDGYEPASARLPVLYYRWGQWLMGQEKPLDAYDKFQKAGEYDDAQAIVKEMTKIFYEQGIKDYHAGDYSAAGRYFRTIGDYQRSKSYSVLIGAHLSSSRAHCYENLRGLIGFEDAAALLVSEQGIAEKFLLGTWKGGGQTFTMKEGGDTVDSFPANEGRGYYYIEDGAVKFYKNQGDDTNTKIIYTIAVIHENCIQVRVTQNSKTYALYRQ